MLIRFLCSFNLGARHQHSSTSSELCPFRFRWTFNQNITQIGIRYANADSSAGKIAIHLNSPLHCHPQAIPAALSGRDIIGIAKTGSGKTGAFVWPAIVHLMAQVSRCSSKSRSWGNFFMQDQLKPGDGPIVLICAPTRELAQQIYVECKKYGKAYNISVVCAFGGGNMHEQIVACQEGCEILVCTPVRETNDRHRWSTRPFQGRLIDLVKKKGTNLQRVTYLVFDEADRMFDMGFVSERVMCLMVVLFLSNRSLKCARLLIMCDPIGNVCCSVPHSRRKWKD
jgi:hypothetical protein